MSADFVPADTGHAAYCERLFLDNDERSVDAASCGGVGVARHADLLIEEFWWTKTKVRPMIPYAGIKISREKDKNGRYVAYEVYNFKALQILPPPLLGVGRFGQFVAR